MQNTLLAKPCGKKKGSWKHVMKRKQVLLQAITAFIGGVEEPESVRIPASQGHMMSWNVNGARETLLTM